MKPIRAMPSRIFKTVLHEIFALMRNRVLEHFETVGSSRVIKSRVMVLRIVHKIREIFVQIWAKTRSCHVCILLREYSM